MVKVCEVGCSASLRGRVSRLVGSPQPAPAAPADRGLARPSALLAAQIGMATFGLAIGAWGGTSASALEGLIAAATAEVRVLA